MFIQASSKRNGMPNKTVKSSFKRQENEHEKFFPTLFIALRLFLWCISLRFFQEFVNIFSLNDFICSCVTKDKMKLNCEGFHLSVSLLIWTSSFPSKWLKHRESNRTKRLVWNESTDWNENNSNDNNTTINEFHHFYASLLLDLTLFHSLYVSHCLFRFLLERMREQSQTRENASIKVITYWNGKLSTKQLLNNLMSISI